MDRARHADGQRRLGIQRGVSRPGSMHWTWPATSATSTPNCPVVALGARLLAPPRREPYGSIANLCDPDGDPFDLSAYH